MLLQGSSLSFLPLYVVRDYIASGELAIIDVDCPEVRMWSQLVYHKNKWVTPQMEIFIHLLKRDIGSFS